MLGRELTCVRGVEGGHPSRAATSAPQEGKKQDDSQTRGSGVSRSWGWCHPEMGTWEEEQVGGTYVGSGHAVKAKLMGLLGPGWKRSVQDSPR